MRTSPELNDTASPETAPVTLFEAWDETGFTGEIETAPEQTQERPSIEALGRRAARSIVELSPLPQRPRTIEVGDVLREIAESRDASDDHDAYSDLGGGMQSYRLQERAGRQRFIVPLDSYQEWHGRTRQAIEQYRLSDMSLGDYEQMTAADRKRFNLHLFAFQDGVRRDKQYIEACDGHIPQGSHLESALRGRFASEVMAYARTLGYLAEDIERTGLISIVRSTLGVPQPNRTWYQERRIKALDAFQKDRKRRGEVQVVFERGKLRLEKKENTR